MRYLYCHSKDISLLHIHFFFTKVTDKKPYIKCFQFTATSKTFYGVERGSKSDRFSEVRYASILIFTSSLYIKKLA